MITSGTIKSDLKAAVLAKDTNFDTILARAKDKSADDTDRIEYIDECVNVRNAILDYLICQININKVKTPDEFDFAVCAIQGRYYPIMLKVTE